MIIKDIDLKAQIVKLEAFRKKHNLFIHPRREAKGGFSYIARIYLMVGHCPCKPDRKKCPCKEALLEIQANGYCECRLFCTKFVYDQLKVLEHQVKPE